MSGLSYLCTVCGAKLDRPEVVEHFRALHPEHYKKAAAPWIIGEKRLQRKLRELGLVKALGAARKVVHTCALCGREYPSYSSATIHLLIEHPEESHRALGRDGLDLPLYEVWRRLRAAGLLARRGSKLRERTANGRKAMDVFASEVEQLVESTVSTLLSRHLGTAARIAPSTVAREILGLNGKWTGAAASLSGAVARVFAKWREERKVVRDARGRLWRVADLTREKNGMRCCISGALFERRGRAGDSATEPVAYSDNTAITPSAG